MAKIDIKKLILEFGKKRQGVSVAEIKAKTGFSRAYINRFLSQCKEEGKIVQIGQTNKTRYVIADKNAITAAKKK